MIERIGDIWDAPETAIIEIARKTQELQPWDRRASPASAALVVVSTYGFLVR